MCHPHSRLDPKHNAASLSVKEVWHWETAWCALWMGFPPIPVFPLSCGQDREVFVKSMMGAHKLHRPVWTQSEHISQGTWKILSSFLQDTSFTVLPDLHVINQRVCCSWIAQEMRSSRRDFPINHGRRLELSGNMSEVLCWLRPLANLLAGLAVHTQKHRGVLPLEPCKGYLLPLTNPPLLSPTFFFLGLSKLTNHIFWPVNQEIQSNMGKLFIAPFWGLLLSPMQCLHCFWVWRIKTGVWLQW